MIDEINKDQLVDMFKIRNYVATLNEQNVFIKQYENIDVNANTSYVKYTSKNSMFKMLESDSLYVFCSELSNDKTENKMLNVRDVADSYISCFYHKNTYKNSINNSSDVLSQWMSYCKNGGAAFELYFGQDYFTINPPEKLVKKATENQYGKYIDNLFCNMHCTMLNQFNYSLLSSNSSDDSDFILYPNFPFQVQYYENTINESDTVSQSLEPLEKKLKTNRHLLIPYLKHSGFVQESEARLAFINSNDRLTKCIKFLDSADGTRIPYIEIKFGNNDLLKQPCKFIDDKKPTETLEKAILRKLKERNNLFNNDKFPIIIPQGRDQEYVFNAVEKALNELANKRMDIIKPKIICQGHLPITKITLAPTEDRAEQRKKMEIFCKTKYWLRNVEICESTIPYNTTNSNHI